MQSQQKRVKWSRGETAEAIEERTDTGVTQASVEFMENCIPDIYGNISRRPALKIVPLSNDYPITQPAPFVGFTYDSGLQIIPFYITETDLILIGIHTHAQPEFLRIKDGKIVSKATASGSSCWSGIYKLTEWVARPISYAQQNNYMVVAAENNVWKIQFSFNNDNTFTPAVELWKFSAGWYAPNGTKTKTISTINAHALGFKGSSICPFVWQDYDVGIATQYSAIWTGLTDYADFQEIENQIPAGSIIELPAIGCHIRVEGFFGYLLPFEDTTFDGVLNPTDSVPATGTYCKCPNASGLILQKFVDGVLVGTYKLDFPEATIRLYVKNTASNTGYSYILFSGAVATHFTTWFQNGSFPNSQSVWMYGSLLTPVADSTAVDNNIVVEYGYKSLQPTTWSDEHSYPHPKKLVFNEQRLWAGAWKDNADEYAITLGSQIARYNDLKNDYNQENEPITLDILTQYKEKIVHLVDYNGLKIMTDAYEYAYNKDTGIVKQSANGSFEYCEPIVFDSLCLYVDSTGCQVKAMQYELQSNIFNSSTINQYTPHDLVWYPWGMATYEDKIHSTGKYLFLVNREDANTRLAVCNFVPSNQANIWSRWKTAKAKIHPDLAEVPLVFNIINTKEQPLFMLNFAHKSSYGALTPIIYPCVLDFDDAVDLTTEPTENNTFAVVKYTLNPGTPLESVQYLTLPSTEVAIYSNGVFQKTAQTDSDGIILEDLSQLTNITVGLPINSTIISHPIDVGGKTKSIKKRIGKSVMSVHDTASGSISINGKTGYMNPQGDKINFYGVTGMKDEIKYTITNKNGAMFHLESLLMNIEYGTLDS